MTMRKLLSFVLLISCLSAAGCQKKTDEQSGEEGLQGTISISGAWALYPMAVKWAEEFQKIHPKVKIDIAAGGAGKGMADCLAEVVDIGMVSRGIYPAEVEKGAWWVSVTKDAVVPTVNENNPVLKELLSKGVKQETFIGIWITEKVKSWSEVSGVETAPEIHVYTRSDACGAAETWAEFLGKKKQEDLTGVGVYGDPGLADAVSKDNLGIGFNNINYAYDAKTKEQIKGIRVLPIDLNNDGVIDTNEDFYKTRDEVAQAIAEGKYPSPPARDLHFVSHGRPKKKQVAEFVKWVLTDGQKYVPEAGYINLSEQKISEQLEKLKGE
jgi:phosphate transport system substrate-binding protein